MDTTIPHIFTPVYTFSYRRENVSPIKSCSFTPLKVLLLWHALYTYFSKRAGFVSSATCHARACVYDYLRMFLTASRPL